MHVKLICGHVFMNRYHLTTRQATHIEVIGAVTRKHKNKQNEHKRFGHWTELDSNLDLLVVEHVGYY